MKEFTYTITDPEGIHARPAGELVKAVKAFSSDIKIAKGGKAMNCKAIFGVMGGLLFCILADLIQKKRHRVEEIGLTGMIFMVCSALSYGFFSNGVDNAAHIGGLIGGFLLTMLSRLLCKNR